MTDVDISAVVAAVIEISHSRAQSEGVTLIWSPPEEALMVRGGEVRLQQVVLNLFSNAMDAMAGQDKAKEVEIVVERDGARVELRVCDTGPGLVEPDRIFDPFYSTKQLAPDGQGHDGRGLGLSISYGLVQSFGGEITGHNREIGGAVFTITLDAAVTEEDAA